MLFDEPLSNLDARLRRSMREEIRALQQRLKLTVAYVTHDQAEALAVSDQIIVMDGGRIAQAGTPQQLYEQPASVFVAGFMGEAMLFDGMVLADGQVQLGPLRFAPTRPVKPGPVRVAVRPEAWRVVVMDAAMAGAAQAGVDQAAGPSLAGVLRKTAYLGSFRELSFDIALGSVFVVLPEGVRAWALGDAATLTLGDAGVPVVAA